MVAKILGAQRDFSFGEVDATLKRNDDHPARKAGLRQMANGRILNSGSVQDRPGRRAIYPVANNGKRTERFTISSGNVYDIQFATNTLKLINSAGVVVATFTQQGSGLPLPWISNPDINSIVYAIMGLNVYITFGHAMRPQVLTFDGVSAWSIADFTEAVTVGGQKRTPFYRISPQNVTLTPSANRGAITVKFSSPIAVAAMNGSRVRFAGRQILLGILIDASTMNATVIEPLPPSQTLTLSASVGSFNVSDVMIGNSSGAKGVVVSSSNIQTLQVSSGFPGSLPLGNTLTGATSGATGIVIGTSVTSITVSLNTGTAFTTGENATATPSGQLFTISNVTSTGLVVQLIQTTPGSAPTFLATEVVGGPSGTATTSAVSTGAPAGISVWDDEVMNNFRGYPASVFTDQFRLGFCDFLSVPGGIGWSAINSPTDMFVDGNPSNAMFEIAPAKVRVYYVIPGPESSEFVFTDRRVYYIPISPTNPLKPGSVQFAILSGDGAAQVQPRIAQEAILYVNAGQNSVMAVIATGAYLRPFNTKNLCDFHAHLFNNIQSLAFPTADGTFSERYAYVLNGDGSIAVGKYDPGSLQTNMPVIGWGPWSGAGVVSWISAHAADVIFTTNYFGTGICEVLDDSQYLDCAILVNSPPAPFAAPAGKGPLWFIAGQPVTLIDQITRVMGTYQIDANGNIVPQGNGGENLAIGSLVAGQPWTMTVEPFCPDASPGQAVGQRMFKRRVSRFAAAVSHSTGFIMARLFSGSLTPTSPALGTVMNFTRFPTWNVGDDVTKPPPQRETVERTRPIGRSFDPRVALIKDMPGPLVVEEIGIECTI